MTGKIFKNANCLHIGIRNVQGQRGGIYCDVGCKVPWNIFRNIIICYAPRDPAQKGRGKSFVPPVADAMKEGKGGDKKRRKGVDRP